MKRFILVLFVLLLVAAGAGAWFYTGVDRPYKGYNAAEQFVEIPQGSGSSVIARRLADAGVVQDVNRFRMALWVTGPDGGSRRGSTGSIGRCRRAKSSKRSRAATSTATRSPFARA